jgi:hypothetical protein
MFHEYDDEESLFYKARYLILEGRCVTHPFRNITLWGYTYV